MSRFSLMIRFVVSSTLMVIVLVSGVFGCGSSPTSLKGSETSETKDILINHEETLTPTEVLDQPASQWVSCEAAPKVLTSDTPTWFRMRLSNDSSRSLERTLASTVAFLNVFDAYVFDAQEQLLAHQKTGLAIPRSQRPVDFPKPAIHITLAPGEVRLIVVRLQSATPIDPCLVLHTPSEVQKIILQDAAMFAAFAAVTVTCILLLGIFALFVRASFVAHFLFFIIFCCLYIIFINGMDRHFIWHEFPLLATRWKDLTGVSAFIFVSLVLDYFLPREARRTRTTLRALLILTVLSGVIKVLVPTASTDAMLGIMGTIICLALVSIPLVGIREIQTKLFLMFGLAGFLVTNAVFTISAFGLWPISVDERFLAVFGIQCLVVFLGCTMGAHLSRLDRTLRANNAELSLTSRRLAEESAQRMLVIEELRQEKETIVELERFRLLGELAGNLAHEINTPLSIISMKAENIAFFVNKQGIKSDYLNGAANSIVEVARRISHVMGTILGIARDEQINMPASCDVNLVMTDVLHLFEERLVRHGIRVLYAIEGESLLVRAKPGSLWRVLINLVKNALDAIDEVEPDRRFIEVRAQVLERTIRISLVNGGPLVTREMREKIFDAFFTTKIPGQGTGLGLTIVRHLMLEQGGRVWLEDSAECTTFVLEFQKA